MKLTCLVLQLVLLLVASLCPQIAEAALPASELKNGISDSNPIYEVAKGELKNVMAGLKDYSIVVLVTSSDPKLGCKLCEDFDPVYKKIAGSIYQKYPSLKDEAFFLRVEASENLEYLKELSVTSVPRVWGFPNSKIVLGEEKYNKIKALLAEQKLALNSGKEFVEPEWYDLKQAGMEHFVFQLTKGDDWQSVIGKFAEFVGNTIHVNVHAALFEETKEGKINWFVTGQWFVYFLVGIKVFQKIRQNSAEGVNFWQDKRIYAYLSLVLIFICVSGFNFALQRSSPFASQKDGKVMWIAPVTNNQLGAEIVISVLLHIVTTGVLIFLVGGINVAKDYKNVVRIIAAFLFAYIIMLGVSVYTVKSPGYPFNYIKLI